MFWGSLLAQGALKIARLFVVMLGRSEGFHRTGYFVPARVWSGRQADVARCSRVGAHAFRAFRKNIAASCITNTFILYE